MCQTNPTLGSSGSISGNEREAPAVVHLELSMGDREEICLFRYRCGSVLGREKGKILSWGASGVFAVGGGKAVVMYL